MKRSLMIFPIDCRVGGNSFDRTGGVLEWPPPWTVPPRRNS